MGAGGDGMSARSSWDVAENYIEQARAFYEPQLAAQGLSEKAINAQTLDQLHASLAKLDVLTAHPEQFGLFRIRMTAKGSGIVVTTQAQAEAQIEIGILPLLLERKQLILDRIKELAGGRKIQTLRELVEQVDDEAMRRHLSMELDTLISTNKDLTEKANVAAQEADKLRERDLRDVREQMLQAGTGIFLVHGHDEVLKLEVARLLENATTEEITILAEQANRGRTVVEKLEQYSRVKFAVVLLTPDDRVTSNEDRKTRGRARQNVILELGLFLGLLGRDRVCALYKSGVEIPSDYSGVLFIQVDDHGGWKFDLLRELAEAEISVDWRRAK
jgi:predicted nucleotide-binding protein